MGRRNQAAHGLVMWGVLSDVQTHKRAHPLLRTHTHTSLEEHMQCVTQRKQAASTLRFCCAACGSDSEGEVFSCMLQVMYLVL